MSIKVVRPKLSDVILKPPTLTVFALTVFARESLLSSILEELAEETELAGVKGLGGLPQNNKWSGIIYCRAAHTIISPNGKSHPRGCAGAVWSDGSGSEKYCKGDNVWGLSKKPWYHKCCTWNGSTEKCEQNAGGVAAYGVDPNRGDTGGLSALGWNEELEMMAA